jgi:hypothetical protein
VLRLWNYRGPKYHLRSEGEQGEFSLARYEPMARLLSEEDLQFVKAQPGYRPEIGKKFSRERRRIFRLYLEELARDFHRLHASARAMVATLPAENAALVGVLIRQKYRFWMEIVALEARLTFTFGSVDVSGLVNAVASMHAEVSRLSAPAAA